MESKNSLSIPLAIIAAGALIAGAVYFSGSGNNNYVDPKGIVPTETKIEPVSAKDHLLGNANAEVVVIEYSDLECPYCKAFHGTMHTILNDYQGKVAWVYRHYPIAELHAKAAKEAEASECAADQGGELTFWQFIDKVFEVTPSNDKLDPSELPKIAQELGLDVSKFNNCLATGVHTQEIEDSIEAAVVTGAQGTPYSIIMSKDGKERIPVNGAEPLATVKAKIDILLGN